MKNFDLSISEINCVHSFLQGMAIQKFPTYFYDSHEFLPIIPTFQDLSRSSCHVPKLSKMTGKVLTYYGVEVSGIGQKNLPKF